MTLRKKGGSKTKKMYQGACEPVAIAMAAFEPGITKAPMSAIAKATKPPLFQRGAQTPDALAHPPTAQEACKYLTGSVKMMGTQIESMRNSVGASLAHLGGQLDVAKQRCEKLENATLQNESWCSALAQMGRTHEATIGAMRKETERMHARMEEAACKVRAEMQEHQSKMEEKERTMQARMEKMERENAALKSCMEQMERVLLKNIKDLKALQALQKEAADKELQKEAADKALQKEAADKALRKEDQFCSNRCPPDCKLHKRQSTLCKYGDNCARYYTSKGCNFLHECPPCKSDASVEHQRRPVRPV